MSTGRRSRQLVDVTGRSSLHLGSEGHFFEGAVYFVLKEFITRGLHSRRAAVHSNQGSNPEHPRNCFRRSSETGLKAGRVGDQKEQVLNFFVTVSDCKPCAQSSCDYSSAEFRPFRYETFFIRLAIVASQAFGVNAHLCRPTHPAPPLLTQRRNSP